MFAFYIHDIYSGEFYSYFIRGLFLSVYLFMCMYAHMSAGAHGGMKRVLGP